MAETTNDTQGALQGTQQPLLVDVTLAKGQGQAIVDLDEGIIVSPPTGPVVNNYMNGLSSAQVNGDVGQTKDINPPKVTSPGTADSRYEFDPLSAGITSKDPFSEISSNEAILVDLEATQQTSPNGIDDASTASATPLSPPPHDLDPYPVSSAEAAASASDLLTSLVSTEPRIVQTKVDENVEVITGPKDPSDSVNEVKHTERHVTFEGNRMQETQTCTMQKVEVKDGEPMVSTVTVETIVTTGSEVSEQAGALEDKKPESPRGSPSKIPASPARSGKKDETGATPKKPPRTKPPSPRSQSAAPASHRSKDMESQRCKDKGPTDSPKLSSRIPSPKKERKPPKDGTDSGIEDDKVTGKSSAEARSVERKAKADNVKKNGVSPRAASCGPRTPTQSAGAPSASKSGSGTKPAARSKVGSLDNSTHKAGGGNVKVVTKKVDVSTVQSRCGSKDNMKHSPRGGDKKIESQKLDFSKVESRCGSKDNMKHTAKGGDKKIESQKLDFSKVESKCGSKANMKHTPKGGDKKIESKKLDFSKVESRCGSKDNIKHTPKGGEKKIESQKLEWKVQSKVGSMDNATHKAAGGDKKIESQKLNWNVESRVGSMDNAKHKAGGGEKKIQTAKLEWNVESKVGSLDNASHTPGGGEKKIETQKLEFKDKATSKVGSKDNEQHKAGGGDKKIETHKVDFKETATSRTDTGGK